MVNSNSYESLGEKDVNTKFDVPQLINVSLYKHQKNSIEKCLELERLGKSRIHIGDNVGSGKTLIAIGISTFPVDIDNEKIYILNKKLRKHIPLSFVFVTKNLYSQWATTLGDSLYKTQYKFLYSLGSIPTVIQDLIDFSERGGKIVLTRVGYLKAFMEIQDSIIFNRLFIDEAIHDNYHITSTLNDLNCFFIHKYCIKDLDSVEDRNNSIYYVSNDKNFIRSQITLPTLYYKYDFFNMNEVFIKKVEGYLDRELLRKLNHDMISQERVLDNILGSLNRERLMFKRGLEFSKVEEERKKIQKSIDKIDTSIENIITRMNTDICVICEDVVDERLIYNCCQNIICHQCGMRVENKPCIHCRSQGWKWSSTIFGDQNPPKLNSMIKTLENIMNKADNFSILICAYGELLESIKKYIKQNLEINSSIYLSILGGSAIKYKETIDGAKSSSKSILLLSSIKDCAGLNLQFITDIIVLSVFDNGTLHQIIGRAYRQGRKKDLRLYIYLYKNEEVGINIEGVIKNFEKTLPILDYKTLPGE